MSPADRITSNGHAPTLDSDDEIVANLRRRIEHLKARREELQSAIEELTPDLRRYEKALLAISGEPINRHKPRGDDTDAADDDTPRRRGPGRVKGDRVGISEERLARIEAAVRQMGSEKDDITQVEVRAVTGDGSGAMAMAFETLRSRNVIRLIRRDGNLKVFRLTRAALAEPTAEPEPSQP